MWKASFNSRIFQHKMKTAKVRSLFKQGIDKMLKITDQYPFYCFFPKTLKKLLYQRLISFVNKHNILSEAQNGFRKMKTTETANQTFIQSIQDSMDQCLHVTGILLDLTKAYDILNYNTLFDNLNSYGIRANMNLWFKSYLSNSSEFIEITQMQGRNFTQYRHTSARKIVHGVPQG